MRADASDRWKGHSLSRRERAGVRGPGRAVGEGACPPSLRAARRIWLRHRRAARPDAASTARLIRRSALRSRTARLLPPFGRETPRGASGWICVAEYWCRGSPSGRRGGACPLPPRRGTGEGDAPHPNPLPPGEGDLRSYPFITSQEPAVLERSYVGRGPVSSFRGACHAGPARKGSRPETSRVIALDGASSEAEICFGSRGRSAS